MANVEAAETPKIYSIVSALQPGSLGPKSRTLQPPACEVCQQSDRMRVEYLDLMLDAWTPCEFISVATTYAVSPALRDRMLAVGTHGAAFRDMSVSRSAMFDMIDPDHDDELPQLFQLEIEAIVPGPSGWWEAAGRCERCGRVIWKGSAATSAALASTRRRPKGPARQISRNDWHGEDLFWTTDPGPPLLTERIKALLDSSVVPELVLHPAQFV